MFKDIIESIFKSSIKVMSKLVVVAGYEDGTYRPKENIDRGLRIFMRKTGNPPPRKTGFRVVAHPSLSILL